MRTCNGYITSIKRDTYRASIFGLKGEPKHTPATCKEMSSREEKGQKDEKISLCSKRTISINERGAYNQLAQVTLRVSGRLTGHTQIDETQRGQNTTWSGGSLP